MRIFNYIMLAAIASCLWACKADKNYPGVEYAPQMYHSVPYEPLTQITEEGIPGGFLESNYYITNSLPYNDYDGKTPINSKEPVAGTVKRQNFNLATGTILDKPGSKLLIYDLHKDSLDLAGRELKNPLPDSKAVAKEGKRLFLSYCSQCHGEKGGGKGKVGQVYKGVPDYSKGRYATLPEGHIFHVITHGKGRMWPHKSQLNPEERWKIVRYVQVLQKGKN